MVGAITSVAIRLIQTPATLNHCPFSTSGRISNFSGKTVTVCPRAGLLMSHSPWYRRIQTYTCRQAKRRFTSIPEGLLPLAALTGNSPASVLIMLEVVRRPGFRFLHCLFSCRNRARLGHGSCELSPRRCRLGSVTSSALSRGECGCQIYLNLLSFATRVRLYSSIPRRV